MIAFETAKKKAEDMLKKKTYLVWDPSLIVIEDFTIWEKNYCVIHFNTKEFDRTRNPDDYAFTTNIIVDIHGRAFGPLASAIGIEFYLLEFEKLLKKYKFDEEKISLGLEKYEGHPFPVSSINRMKRYYRFYYGIYSFFWHILKRIQIYCRKIKRKKIKRMNCIVLK